MLNVSGLFNCHHLPPSSSSYCTQEGDEFRRVCKSGCLCDMKENKETWWVDWCVKWDDEKKKKEPSSFINPSTRTRTVLISSVFHLTVHIPVCVCNAACVGGRVTEIHLENKSTFGMFHSILKHAEHRTLNTYTEQLVLSKCSFSFFCLVFVFLFFIFFPRTEWF